MNREVVSYLIFGVLTTLVGYGSYALFRYLMPDGQSVPEFLQFLYALGGDSKTVLPNILSWICAVIFAYVTNRAFVFQSKAQGFHILREIISFVAARILTLFISIAIMFLLIDLPKVDNVILEIAAKLFEAVVVVILNYVFSKLFVFKKKKTE
jgi:putative flippase GtrA